MLSLMIATMQILQRREQEITIALFLRVRRSFNGAVWNAQPSSSCIRSPNTDDYRGSNFANPAVRYMHDMHIDLLCKGRQLPAFCVTSG
jgi:hypothetical protein